MGSQENAADGKVITRFGLLEYRDPVARMLFDSCVEHIDRVREAQLFRWGCLEGESVDQGPASSAVVYMSSREWVPNKPHSACAAGGPHAQEASRRSFHHWQLRFSRTDRESQIQSFGHNLASFYVSNLPRPPTTAMPITDQNPASPNKLESYSLDYTGLVGDVTYSLCVVPGFILRKSVDHGEGLFPAAWLL